MARAKVIEFSDGEQVTAVAARALGHPARVRIMRHIRSRGVVGFPDLQRDVPLCDATIAQHLRMLERAHLIQEAYLADGSLGYTVREEVRQEAFALLAELLAA